MPKSAPAEPAPAAKCATRRTQTAAQLAAQRQLQDAEREVQLAKIDLEDFVGRKRALQKQIDFERSLASGDQLQRENIARALETLEARLEKLRVTVLRDLEGRVHFMPNGGIDHVTNRTYAWGRRVFEIPVRFDEDVDRVIDVLRMVAREMSNAEDWKGSIIGEPDMLGEDKVTESGVIVKRRAALRRGSGSTRAFVR